MAFQNPVQLTRERRKKYESFVLSAKHFHYLFFYLLFAEGL